MKQLEQHFLDQVCAEIKAKKCHPEIRQELASHLEDLISEREALGIPREEATAWAIAQMGSPQSIGKELHQIHKPRVPWGIFGVIALLTVISLIGMASVNMGYGSTYKANGYGINWLGNQATYILIGIITMFIMYFINFRKLKRLSWILYGFAIAGIFTSILWGVTVNGVNHGVHFFFITTDTTTYRPYVLMVALAGILISRQESAKTRSWGSALIDIMIIILPAFLLIFLKTFPELAVYLVSSIVLYTWITRDWLKSVVLFGAFITVGLFFIINNEALMERIMGAIAPSQDLNGFGYIYHLIHQVITTAGWWGHGFGSMHENLPYAYSDFFSVYFIHTFGWAGGLLLLAVIFYLFIKLLSTIRSIREPYGQALVVGLAFLLAIRLVYGLAVLSGRMMVTSIPFPFISYGSHVWFEYAAIGLLMGIYRRKDMMPVQEETVSN